MTETTVSGGKILVGLRVTGLPPADGDVGELSSPADRWQILTVRDGLVTEIVGFDARDEAVAWSGFG